MKIILCDKNKEVIEACRKLTFDTDDTIEIIHGDIFDQKFDAIATPSNSFGFMDGNFDLEIIKRYGIDVEKCIKTAINHNWSGELPIGCTIVWGGSSNDRTYVIVAPTMRVPMHICGTVNAYLAMAASFKSCDMASIALPAFGTGCGWLSPEIFARQFKAAVEHYKKPPVYETWQDAQREHNYLAGIS